MTGTIAGSTRIHHRATGGIAGWDWPIRLALVLWPLPFGFSRVLGLPALAFAAPMLAAATYAHMVVAGSRSSEEGRPPALRVVLFLACYGCFALAMTRTQMPGTSMERVISLAGNILAPALFFAAAAYTKSRARSVVLFGYFLWSIPVYLAVDLALSGNQIDSSTTQIGRLAETAFMGGANTIGVIAGLCILLGIHNYRVGNFRLGAVVMAIVASVVLVLCDSRAAIVAAALVSLLLLFSPTIWITRLAYASLLFSVVSAPLLLGVFSLLADSAIAELFTRSGALGTRLGLGTGRTVLWEAVLQSLGRMPPEHFIGYGYGSAAKAGAEAAFYYIFYSENAYVRQPLSPTLHNMSLQTIFDVGYVGLLLYVAMILVVINLVRRDITNPHGRVMLAIISYIMLCGYTESGGTIYHFEVFVFFMGLSAFVLMQNKGGISPDTARGAP